MSDAHDLQAVLQANTDLTLAGKTLVINRIRMRQLPRVMELIQPMASVLMKKLPAQQQVNNQPVNKKISQINISELVLKHGYSLVQLIAEIEAYGNDGVDETWVGDLEIDDMIVLTQRVLEVNLDFFIQRVLPALSTALGSLNANVQLRLLGGLTPSKP